MIETTIQDHGVETAGQDLVDFSLHEQRRHETATSAESRKKRGQFFTPPPVARFMASLFSTPPRHFKVLDPGAGAGVLSAAVCDRLSRLKTPRRIELVLFETDDSVVPRLRATMDACRERLGQAGHEMSYEVHGEDFILASPPPSEAQLSLFGTQDRYSGFDAVIMNPPYFKLAKDCAHARVMHRIVHGQPNMYALFMALACEALKENGELVAITPRSFCGGLYFREFRRWFLGRMSLRHIHLFESRTKAFPDANVLQESVVTASVRSPQAPTTVTLSTSHCAGTAENPHKRQVRTCDVLDDRNGQMVVRIPEREEDLEVMRFVEAWPDRFTDHGLRISTGPVVTFRAKEYLLDSTDEGDCVPLLAVHNVRPFETAWPVEKNGKPTAFRLCQETIDRRLLIPARNCVLVRRFSAKEEKRRLTASCLFRRDQQRPYIALENHLNYVCHADRELSDEETFGLAALLNSALLDRYFRVLSGNTQVNATEVRTIHLPAWNVIQRTGRQVRAMKTLSSIEIERIVLNETGVRGALRKYLEEHVRCEN